MQKTDKVVFLLWDCTCELREWLWFFQQLLAGGQYTAQGSPQTLMWRQSHRVPALRFVLPFLYLQWSLCWQSHGKRQLYFCQWLQHILRNPLSQNLKSQVREFEAEHSEQNLEEINTLWTYHKDWKAPNLFYSLIFFPWAQSSPFHCAGERTHTSQDCRQEQGWSKTPALRPAAGRHSSGSETTDREKPLLAVAGEMKCYCPLRLPVFCCSNTIITPPSAVLCACLSPGAAFSAVSDLPLPHNPQELLQPDLSRPYRTDQNYKIITAFPTLEQRQSLEGRDASNCLTNRFFSHFPIAHSKLHTYMQGQNPVLRSWISDLDKWQAAQSPFFGRNCLQYNLLHIQTSVSFKQNLPELTISNLFFLLHSLLYFLLCIVPASPFRGVSLGKFMSLVLFTLWT